MNSTTSERKQQQKKQKAQHNHSNARKKTTAAKASIDYKQHINNTHNFRRTKPNQSKSQTAASENCRKKLQVEIACTRVETACRLTMKSTCASEKSRARVKHAQSGRAHTLQTRAGQEQGQARCKGEQRARMCKLCQGSYKDTSAHMQERTLARTRTRARARTHTAHAHPHHLLPCPCPPPTHPRNTSRKSA